MFYRHLLMVLHIAAVAGWLGLNFAQFFLTPRLGARPGAVATAWWQSSAFLAKTYVNVLLVVVLVTGILLVVRDGPYEFSNAFVSIGFLAVIVRGGLSAMQFGPWAEKAALASTGGDAGGVQAAAQRTTLLTLVDTCIVVITLVGMVAKWGL